MEPQDRTDPLARERARKRRAKQIQRRRLVLALCVLGLIILIVGLVVGLSGGSDDQTGTTSTTQTTETGESTATSAGAGSEESSSTTAVTSQTFTAELTGDQSVPAVTTQAKATLTLKYDAKKKTMSFVLDVVSALSKPNVATIYEGTAGQSGAAVVTLFSGPEKGTSFEGVLAEGLIDEKSLTGSLEGKTIKDLAALIAAGNAYVSIGNASHPVDAIRGQIK